MNVIEGKASQTGFEITGHGQLAKKGIAKAVKCGIRPEHIKVSNKAADVTGTVVLYEYLGADCFIYVDCGAAGVLTVRVDDQKPYTHGETVGLVFEKKRLHYFDENDLTC